MDVLPPRSLEEALRLKAEHPECVPIQGGTDVMVELNFDRARPSALLNLNNAELQLNTAQNQVSTGKLASEQSAQVGKIKGGFDGLNSVTGTQLHPNKTVIDGMDVLCRKYAKEVLDGWQLAGEPGAWRWINPKVPARSRPSP